MTLTLYHAVRGLQVLGALLALTGVVVAATSPYCASSLHLQVGAIGLLLDGGALLMRRGSAGAIPLSLLKLVVIGSGTFVLISCAPVIPAPAALFPNGTAFTLLLGSTLPSILGAFFLRIAR